MKFLLIEGISKGKINILTGQVYKHPNMNLSEIIEPYINELLNIELLHHSLTLTTSEFIVSLSSKLFLPHTIKPNIVGENSRT